MHLGSQRLAALAIHCSTGWPTYGAVIAKDATNVVHSFKFPPILLSLADIVAGGNVADNGCDSRAATQKTDILQASRRV